jgi:hypothetical protein
VLALVAPPLGGEGAKIRFAGSAGGAFENELVGSPGFTGGGGLHLAYPVSSLERPVGVEISIANWYNAFPGDDSIHLFRLGFGIRVFLNLLRGVRPYFTHDICTHLLWQGSREGYAAAIGILLGLGLDVPLKPGSDGRKAESSSLFCDLSYNSFELAHFTEPRSSVKFVALTLGFSWLTEE